MEPNRYTWLEQVFATCAYRHPILTTLVLLSLAVGSLLGGVIVLMRWLVKV